MRWTVSWFSINNLHWKLGYSWNLFKQTSGDWQAWHIKVLTDIVVANEEKQIIEGEETTDLFHYKDIGYRRFFVTGVFVRTRYHWKHSITYEKEPTNIICYRRNYFIVICQKKRKYREIQPNLALTDWPQLEFRL